MKNNQSKKPKVNTPSKVSPPMQVTNIVSIEFTEMLIRQVKILASTVNMLINKLNIFYDKHGFRQYTTN